MTSSCDELGLRLRDLQQWALVTLPAAVAYILLNQQWHFTLTACGRATSLGHGERHRPLNRYPARGNTTPDCSKYVQCNMARSRNHCCREKGISIIIPSVCVCSRSYSTCKTHARYYTVICILSGSTIFFHVISYVARSSEKNFIEHKMCFDFLYNFCLNTTRSKKNGARYYHKGTQVFM